MRIGELAKQTGATPKAIRLYESLDLLGSVRREGSYRQYSQQQKDMVIVIRQAQALGFKLSELTSLVTTSGELNWNSVLVLLKNKRRTLAKSISTLTQQDRLLQQFEEALLIELSNVSASCETNLSATAKCLTSPK